MRRTTIKPKRLYELAREYMALRHVPISNPGGGRPREYDDALILTIACIQNLNSYSFREALEYCEDYFKELPALSTYHDRLALLTSDIAQGFVEYIGKQIQSTSKDNKKTSKEKGRLFVVDGTGFSYHDIYPMKLHRGTEIRKIKAHVKIGALLGMAGQRRFVVSAKAGCAYRGDVPLVTPLLENLPKGHGAVLGDKGFDSIALMTLIQSKGYVPVIPIKQYHRWSAQDPLRVQSDQNATKPIYKKRTLIEGLFGNVKQKLSSHIRVFKTEIAKVFALLRLALLNVSVLVSIEKEAMIWIWFPNSATRDGQSCIYKSNYIQNKKGYLSKKDNPTLDPASDIIIITKLHLIFSKNLVE